MVDSDGRMKTDGRRLDGYTISSPCEPNGSGELIIFISVLLHNPQVCTKVCTIIGM